jgi:hypothetical protein
MIELVNDNVLLVVGSCNCKGDPECDCWTVYGERTNIVGTYELGPLLHNLAVAGALTKAWRLGDQHGFCLSDWRPNTEGRAA